MNVHLFKISHLVVDIYLIQTTPNMVKTLFHFQIYLNVHQKINAALICQSLCINVLGIFNDAL